MLTSAAAATSLPWKDAGALKDWFVSELEMDDDQQLKEAADLIFNQGGIKIDRLRNIKASALTSVGVAHFLAQELENKLKDGIVGIEKLIADVKTVDITWCRLPKDAMSKRLNLISYMKAAEVCAGKTDTQNILGQLGNYTQGQLQEFSYIIAPSGTGKSQLAATAVETGDWNVVYFYTGSAGSDDAGIQPFYFPHVSVREILFKCVKEFESSAIYKDTGANTISKNSSEQPLIMLLHRCFFPGDTEICDTVPALRERIGKVRSEEGTKTLLVFLDEVPPADSSDKQFVFVMLLRNVLRALGVKPILMSTHSGAINAVKNAVKLGSDSRSGTEDAFWCHVFVDLPKYQTGPGAAEENPWLVPTERPLVAAYMEEGEEKTDLGTIVSYIQQKLQRSKKLAWLDNPALQLCQLLRSKESHRIKGIYKHRIVGHHFGRVIEEGVAPFRVTREEAAKWIERCKVHFVEPEKEPVLFLALATWKWDDISSTTASYFPLMSNKRMKLEPPQALSIREAFEASSQYFTKPINTDNDQDKSLDGDDLEVLALASISLSSLQSDGGVFQSVPLPTFFANVFHFMRNSPLDPNGMKQTAQQIETILKGETGPIAAMAKFQLPTCPSSGSNFQAVGWNVNLKPGASKTGKIVRPASKEMRDGYMRCQEKDALHVECKNYAKGLTTNVFKNVVHRIRNNTPLSLLFTSDICGMFEKEGAWEAALNAVGWVDTPHVLCFLVLDHSKGAPYWLEFKNGGSKLTMKPTNETKYLMVVIATSPVEPELHCCRSSDWTTFL